jgi:hypothetical protein
METHSGDAARNEAADALDALADDRDRLSSRVRIPWPLMAAYGALCAWWVAAAATTTPGANYEPPASAWLAFVGVFVVAHLVQRELGVRFRNMGARATWATISIIVIALALFSVSLGLVSLGAGWAVVLTSLVAFGSTTLLAGYAYRSALDHLRRG